MFRVKSFHTFCEQKVWNDRPIKFENQILFRERLMHLKHFKILLSLFLLTQGTNTNQDFHGKSPPVVQNRNIGRLLSKQIETAIGKWSQYEHDEIKTTDQLNSNSNLSKREVLKYSVRYEDGKEFHCLLERDGRLNPKPQWMFVKPRFTVDDKMFSDIRYDFNIEKGFYENGERFLFLTFKPTDNPPAHGDRDKVLNNMTGTVILREKDLFPIKIRAELPKEMEVKGSGYKIKFFKLIIEVWFQKIDGTLMLEKVLTQYHFQLKVLYLFNVREENKKEEYVYSNFKRRR